MKKYTKEKPQEENLFPGPARIITGSGAGIIVENPTDGKILCVQERLKDKDQRHMLIWSIPSGKAKSSESPLTTALRKLYEEASFDVIDREKVAAILSDELINGSLSFSLFKTTPDNIRPVVTLQTSNDIVTSRYFSKDEVFGLIDAGVFKNKDAKLLKENQNKIFSYVVTEQKPQEKINTKKIITIVLESEDADTGDKTFVMLERAGILNFPEGAIEELTLPNVNSILRKACYEATNINSLSPINGSGIITGKVSAMKEYWPSQYDSSVLIKSLSLEEIITGLAEGQIGPESKKIIEHLVK